MNVRESLKMLNQAQQLADSGRHAAVLDYLRDWSEEKLSDSPTLALLYGIAHGRLGSHEAGSRWIEIARERAQERGDRVIHIRALNASGALAFEGGQIDHAFERFTCALSEAERAGDHGTVGRCSNNLGIIASLRGDYGRALGSYTMAIAAFQRAGLTAGIAEALHNLAISYREQGDLDNALETADRAVETAEEAGDVSLAALARGGRAEMRLFSGDPRLARREVEQALASHREVGNAVGEAEDLRVLAGTLAALDETSEAERLYRTVVATADALHRPLLAAQAERDLARLLYRIGQVGEARETARTARVRFMALGADAEVRTLDEVFGDVG